MNNFIIKTDYPASIHTEILASLTRDDDSVIEICEDRAVSEMRSYMSSRYDCDAIFSASGDKRHPLVLMMAIDITVYHIFCIHNPQKLSQIRKDRYDRAIEWLKAVSKGQITIEGAPALSVSDDTAQSAPMFNMRSNPRRNNRF